MRGNPLPIQRIAGNIVFNREGDAWACFSVRCRSYRAEPQKRRAALVNDLTQYAQTAQADFQILRVSRRFDPVQYAQRLRDQASSEHHGALWNDYIDQHEQLLHGLKAWTPEVFICVRLAEPTKDLASQASHLFDRTPTEWFDLARKKVTSPRTTGAQGVAERAKTAEARIAILNARPATYAEIQWLARRAFCRGVAEPREAPDVDDGHAVRYWFGENGVEPSYRCLRTEGDFGEAFQVGLCLGEIGHAYQFTRQVELMFTALEEHPWLIDAALNVRHVSNEQARRQVKTQHARKSVELLEEENATHGAMQDAHDRVALSRELHDRLSGPGSEPLLEGTLSFIVSSPTEQETMRRALAFKDGFPWQTLYWPYGDQLDIWLQHLPGQPSRVQGYERHFTTEQIGAMVPHATHNVGSANGQSMYIARTVHGSQPVFLDLCEASRTNQPPTIVLLGTLGGGKTMTLLGSLGYQAFLQGARMVDIDPKGDHRLHLLPEVAPHAQTIYLGSDPEHSGKLDPLRNAPEAQRHDAAASFLIDVLHNPDEAIRAPINGAITNVTAKYGAEACCMEVVKELEREGEIAGKYLRSYCEAGIVRLGFARLEDPLPTRMASQMVYLNTRALIRSGTGTEKSEMTQAQRHSRAALQLVVLYSMKLLGEERDSLKYLSFDEASAVKEDALGRQFLDTTARWARSELAVAVFSTQLLDDLADLDNLVGHWFLFGMQTVAEARRALNLVGADQDGPLATALVERYGEGRALYRDLQKRFEEIQMDPGARLLKELDTTPIKQRQLVAP